MVHEAQHLTVWESHLALVGIYVVHALGYQIGPLVM